MGDESQKISNLEKNNKDIKTEKSDTKNNNQRTEQIDEKVSLKRKMNEDDNAMAKKCCLDVISEVSSPKHTDNSSAILSKSCTAEAGDIKLLEYTFDDEEEFYLTISNLPNEWTYVDIKNYFDTECGTIDELEMLDGNKIRLTFQRSDKCKEIQGKLQGKEVLGKTLQIELTELTLENDKNVESESVLNVSESTDIIPLRPWRPDENVWDRDPNGLYGLRPEFLKSLNINPPLDSWVYVSNFRCDKSELRDVMELAGHVIMCQAVFSKNKYAKVMYSHPLEAVQAVAMFNDQPLYGQKIKVAMFRNPSNMYILPKGLTNVGVGLGPNGKPLRNVVNEFQRYIKRKDSDINPLLFASLNEDENDSEHIFKIEEDSDSRKKEIDSLIETSTKNLANRLFTLKNVEDMDVNNDTNTPNKPDDAKKSESSKPNTPTTTKVKPNTAQANATGSNAPRGFSRPKMRPNQVRPMNMGPGPMMRPGPMIRPGPMNFNNRPQPAPFMQGPRPGPFPVQGPYGPHPGPFGPRPMGPMQQGMNCGAPYGGPNPQMGTNYGNKVMVEFSNLPPTTTFPILSEKLSHCGQVLSVQLTTPGCAIATFGHPSQAELCFQTFNQMNVEGYVIGVKYV